MNSIQKVAHHIVSSIANDLRENTLTNIVSIAAGGIGGGVKRTELPQVVLQCLRERLQVKQ